MMEMNFSDPRFWLDALQTAVIALLWMRKPGEDAGKRIGDVEADMKVVKERLQHAPTNNELAELGGSMRALVSDVEGLRDVVTITRESVRRIEDFLLNNK